MGYRIIIIESSLLVWLVVAIMSKTAGVTSERVPRIGLGPKNKIKIKIINLFDLFFFFKL